jgi:ankyrin repeat protein
MRRFYAVQKGFSECVRLLVRAGANPHFVVNSAGGMSIVQIACNGSNVETLRQVIEVVNVNECMQNGRTALHWACYYGKMGFVRALVAAGASVHIQDEEGCTPLFWAVCVLIGDGRVPCCRCCCAAHWRYQAELCSCP